MLHVACGIVRLYTSRRELGTNPSFPIDSIRESESMGERERVTRFAP
jgi:hypothetical protein